jgi:DNA-binding response OmpR family regulator
VLAGGAKRVIVIDDDVLSRALAADFLAAGGYEVEATDSPLRAVQVVRDRPPDLVLADLTMAVLDAVPRWERRKGDPDATEFVPLASEGYAILRPLQVDPTSTRYPVVFLKESDDPALRPGAPRFGVIDQVQKPFTPESLLGRIGAILRRLESSPGLATELPSDASESAPVFESLPPALRTVLIVDADEASRATLTDLLRPHGFNVFEAEEGDQGLRQALSRRPWLIITEVNTPGVDGFEFCRRVRSHSLLKHTPLIFLSNWDDYRERYLGLKLGADDYLPKRSSSRELLIRVQLVLKRYTEVGGRVRRGAGMEGSIETIGVTGLLQMLHLGRLSGVCTVRWGSEMIHVRFRDGEVVGAESAWARGLEVVYSLLAWSRGHFEFVPGEGVEGAPLGESFDQMLLEGCRLLDERSRSGEEGVVAAQSGA